MCCVSLTTALILSTPPRFLAHSISPRLELLKKNISPSLIAQPIYVKLIVTPSCSPQSSLSSLFALENSSAPLCLMAKHKRKIRRLYYIQIHYIAPVPSSSFSFFFVFTSLLFLSSSLLKTYQLSRHMVK